MCVSSILHFECVVCWVCSFHFKFCWICSVYGFSFCWTCNFMVCLTLIYFLSTECVTSIYVTMHWGLITELPFFALMYGFSGIEVIRAICSWCDQSHSLSVYCSYRCQQWTPVVWIHLQVQPGFPWEILPVADYLPKV